MDLSPQGVQRVPTVTTGHCGIDAEAPGDGRVSAPQVLLAKITTRGSNDTSEKFSSSDPHWPSSQDADRALDEESENSTLGPEESGVRRSAAASKRMVALNAKMAEESRLIESARVRGLPVQEIWPHLDPTYEPIAFPEYPIPYLEVSGGGFGSARRSSWQDIRRKDANFTSPYKRNSSCWGDELRSPTMGPTPAARGASQRGAADALARRRASTDAPNRSGNFLKVTAANCFPSHGARSQSPTNLAPHGNYVPQPNRPVSPRAGDYRSPSPGTNYANSASKPSIATSSSTSSVQDKEEEDGGKNDKTDKVQYVPAPAWLVQKQASEDGRPPLRSAVRPPVRSATGYASGFPQYAREREDSKLMRTTSDRTGGRNSIIVESSFRPSHPTPVTAQAPKPNIQVRPHSMANRLAVGTGPSPAQSQGPAFNSPKTKAPMLARSLSMSEAISKSVSAPAISKSTHLPKPTVSQPRPGPGSRLTRGGPGGHI